MPVVGARVGGVPELVAHEVNGLLYDAFDSEALASALRRILDEPGCLDRFARSLPPAKTIEDDASGWDDLYRAVVRRAAQPTAGGVAG